MLAKLSVRITNYYVGKKMISEKSSEMFNYCFEILLATIINLLAVLIIGFSTGNYLESILFSIVFMLLRGSAGGYHADTHFRCFMFLMVNFSIFIVLLELVSVTVLLYTSIAFMIFALLVVLIVAPIDCANKRMEKNEKRKKRLLSYLYISIFSLAYIVLSVFNVTRFLSFSISYSSMAVGISLILGVIKNNIIARKEERKISIEIYKL